MNRQNSFRQDLLVWVFLFSDIVFIPEVIDILFLWLKPGMTSLSEKSFGQRVGLPPKIISTSLSILQNSIWWKTVKINPSANILNRNGKYAFVSFYTIHFDRKLSEKTFVHELIHIWQYQKYGSAYIVYSLFAQKSQEAYDYGGISQLMNEYARQKQLEDFNFEQQGEILSDYYSILKMDLLPIHKKEHLVKIYEYFIQDIIHKKTYRWIY